MLLSAVHEIASAMVRNSTKPNLPSPLSKQSSTGSPSLAKSCRLAETIAALKNCLSMSAVSPTPSGRLPTCSRRARRVSDMALLCCSWPPAAGPAVRLLSAASAPPLVIMVARAAGLLCTAAAICIDLLCCCSCASCEFRPVSAGLPPPIRPGCASAAIASGLDAAIAAPIAPMPPMPPMPPIAPAIMPPDWRGHVVVGPRDAQRLAEELHAVERGRGGALERRTELKEAEAVVSRHVHAVDAPLRVVVDGQLGRPHGGVEELLERIGRQAGRQVAHVQPARAPGDRSLLLLHSIHHRLLLQLLHLQLLRLHRCGGGSEGGVPGRYGFARAVDVPLPLLTRLFPVNALLGWRRRLGGPVALAAPVALPGAPVPVPAVPVPVPVPAVVTAVVVTAVVTAVVAAARAAGARSTHGEIDAGGPARRPSPRDSVRRGDVGRFLSGPDTPGRWCEPPHRRSPAAA
eukprot:scaffold18781_cov51-Phaeocystis_antarctica.AAC.2